MTLEEEQIVLELVNELWFECHIRQQVALTHLLSLTTTIARRLGINDIDDDLKSKEWFWPKPGSWEETLAKLAPEDAATLREMSERQRKRAHQGNTETR